MSCTCAIKSNAKPSNAPNRKTYVLYLIQFQVGLKNVNKKPGGA